MFFFFFFQAEDGIRDLIVTGVQTCALPIFARAPMLFVVGKVAGGAIAVVRDFKAGGLQPIDQARGAQSGRRLLGSGHESCCTGGRANEGNLLRLTDDFDRQVCAPCFVVPSTAPGRESLIPAYASPASYVLQPLDTSKLG